MKTSLVSLKGLLKERERLLNNLNGGKKTTVLGINQSHRFHRNTIHVDHPESASRIREAQKALETAGLWEKCQILENCPMVSTDQLSTTHCEDYLEVLKDISEQKQHRINRFCAQFDSVFMTKSSENAAREAVSVCVKMVDQILSDKASNGFAIVRPPGHHAEFDEACGFCIYNNAAQAAQTALEKGCKRVLIVDLDVHHGQGTQKIFYESEKVLYFSIHRYEKGKYWPHLEESNFNAIGKKNGTFYNANVPLNETGCGDADYMFILWNILMPMATQYDPDFIIVSAGFDSCAGDPLGKMNFSHEAYAQFVFHLKSLASGQILMILEGGYNQKIMAKGVVECTKVLLGQDPPRINICERPKKSTIESCLGLVNCHTKWDFFEFWPRMDEELKIFKPDFSYEKPTEEYLKTTTNIDQQSLEGTEGECSSPFLEKENVIYYDETDKLHFLMEEDDFVECPARTKHILRSLNSTKDTKLVKNTRIAERCELELVHSTELIDLLKSTEKMSRERLLKLGSTFNTVFFTKETFHVARRAVGAVLQSIDDMFSTTAETSRRSFVVTRPPGHHASATTPMGFCIFNNVAIGAEYAMKKHNVKKVLIVDWDIHHGNGTQKIFEDNPNVLFISIHKSNRGSFFPSKIDEMSSEFVGKNSGRGFTVNIPFHDKQIGDSEYQAVLFKLIMPIATEFNPDLVLVSCGFDAVDGDPLGGYQVSPVTFAQMAYHLGGLAAGRIVFVLEGGYNVNKTAESAAHLWNAVVERQLKERPAKGNLRISKSAWSSIRNVVEQQKPFWKCLRRQLRVIPRERITKNGTKAILKIKNDPPRRSTRLRV